MFVCVYTMSLSYTVMCNDSAEKNYKDFRLGFLRLDLC
jgi:hypothetical protein